MKYFLLSIVVAVATAIPLEFVNDEDGQQYALIPVVRGKRQTKWDVSNSGVSLGHKGTILDNNNHKLDGSGYASKNFESHGLKPDQFGGRLDYTHKPSGSNAFVGADHTRNFGTDVKAGAQYNILHSKNADLGVVGQYQRHFGGPSGTGKPQGYVGLSATARF